ncbi:replication protein C, IncQ-type [Cupriavidus pinatubonensis]|uniref:Replication protein C n=1 Tax=Cupriavidus pinatubonensis TaxID=248026 RepID=A0ABN7Z4C0_9BURK|nr:replication protein C, IncQ-type [Cupriavidus pinatubonensis]CAG9179216.1 hypothetical protein LMG23994_04098 [Cupriavidus pinatubonensis]
MSAANVRPRIVRYDPMLPSAGLFRSVGNHARPKLDVECEFNGVIWRLRGPDLLGVPEQTLLLVLMELASEQCRPGKASEPEVPELHEALRMSGFAAPLGEASEPVANLAVLSVSYRELNRRCGRLDDGGASATQIRKELERLCEVTVWAKMPDGRQLSSRLLHWRRGDRQGVEVVLNWRLTEILVGRQFSPVSLTERLQLSSDIARALHCVLSVRIRPGGAQSFHLETLASYVWAEDAVAASTVRRRRQLLRDALQEIDSLGGWLIREDERSIDRFKPMLVVRKGNAKQPREKPRSGPSGRTTSATVHAPLRPLQESTAKVDVVAFFRDEDE